MEEIAIKLRILQKVLMEEIAIKLRILQKVSIEEIAIKLRILQKVSNEERVKKGLSKLGKGYFDAYRLNPYNPLSYLIVLCAAIVGLVMYGVVGIFEKVENPFFFFYGSN